MLNDSLLIVSILKKFMENKKATFTIKDLFGYFSRYNDLSKEEYLNKKKQFLLFSYLDKLTQINKSYFLRLKDFYQIIYHHYDDLLEEKHFKLIPKELLNFEICDLALKRDDKNFKHIPDNLKTKEQCVDMVSSRKNYLLFVPENLKDKDFYLKLINENEDLFTITPHDFKDYGFCLDAIKNGCHLYYVKNTKPKLEFYHFENEDFFIEALKANPANEAYLPKELFKNIDFCLKALEYSPNFLGHLRKLDKTKTIITKEMCLNTLKLSEELNQKVFVNEVWPKTYEVLKFVPSSLKDGEICLKAVEICHSNFDSVPFKFLRDENYVIKLLETSQKIVESFEDSELLKKEELREVFKKAILEIVENKFLNMKEKINKTSANIFNFKLSTKNKLSLDIINQIENRTISFIEKLFCNTQKQDFVKNKINEFDEISYLFLDFIDLNKNVLKNKDNIIKTFKSLDFGSFKWYLEHKRYFCVLRIIIEALKEIEFDFIN